MVHPPTLPFRHFALLKIQLSGLRTCVGQDLRNMHLLLLSHRHWNLADLKAFLGHVIGLVGGGEEYVFS